MKTSDLLSELHKLAIPSSWFLIGEKGFMDNKTCLQYIEGTWAVFYYERGKKHETKTFDSEDAACKELLLRLKSRKELREALRKEGI